MRGDMWEPPVRRSVITRRIMVGFPGRPPIVVQQVVISMTREESDGELPSGHPNN